MDVKVGHIYRHFKGGIYKIVRIAKHSETLEDLVIYENAEGEAWARPLEMFLEEVDKDGQRVPRFFLQK